MINRKKVGKRIEHYRKEAKLTQKEVGEKIGVCGSTIGAWERGKQRVSANKIKKLCAVLDIPAIRLFEEKNRKTKRKTVNCSKCGKEMEVPGGHCSDYGKEKLKTLKFVCSECISNEILKKELCIKLNVNPEEKYNTEVTAKKLGIHAQTVRNKIKEDKIKAKNVGTGKMPRYSISGEQILEYLMDRQKQKGYIYRSLY